MEDAEVALFLLNSAAESAKDVVDQAYVQKESKLGLSVRILFAHSQQKKFVKHLKM